MESMMKLETSTVGPAAPALMVAALNDAGVTLVTQAMAAIGEPDTLVELAQRLATTLSMLWPDMQSADLFLPQGHSGELSGLRDASGGVGLLRAVSSTYAGDPNVRVIPMAPTVVAADPGAGRGTCMSVPVVVGLADRRLEGFVIVQRRAGASGFGAADLETLVALARGVSALIPRVQARGERSAAAWLERDMAAAREMQRLVLPRPMQANSAGARVLAEYHPAFDVGGDFYDIVDLGGGRLLAAIGDVSGKGVTAALMMSRISSELHRLATVGGDSPADVLARLNRSIPSGGMQDDRFVTVVCVLLDAPGRRWVVANAGHVVPMLRRRSGTVSGLGYSSGPPVGMLPNAEYADEVFPLERGDILVLSTDGVFENVEGPRRPCSTIGHCKLTEIVEKSPHDLAEIHRSILKAVARTSVGRDDVALLGLELPE